MTQAATPPPHRQLIAILARATNGVIGRDGALPWHIPDDLKRFKRLTMGHPMIMGRKTFDSFPRPLPGRRHIVLTRNRAWQTEGAEVAHSVEDALAMAGDEDAFVIGGAEVYRLMMPHITRIELTEVDAAPDGDTYMPPFDNCWIERERAAYPASSEHPAYAFVTLEKGQ